MSSEDSLPCWTSSRDQCYPVQRLWGPDYLQYGRFLWNRQHNDLRLKAANNASADRRDVDSAPFKRSECRMFYASTDFLPCCPLKADGLQATFYVFWGCNQKSKSKENNHSNQSTPTVIDALLTSNLIYHWDFRLTKAFDLMMKPNVKSTLYRNRRHTDVKMRQSALCTPHHICPS